MSNTEQGNDTHGGEVNREPELSQASGFAGMFVALLFVGTAELTVKLGLFSLDFRWWVWLLGALFTLGLCYVESRKERQQLQEVAA